MTPLDGVFSRRSTVSGGRFTLPVAAVDGHPGALPLTVPGPLMEAAGGPPCWAAPPAARVVLCHRRAVTRASVTARSLVDRDARDIDLAEHVDHHVRHVLAVDDLLLAEPQRGDRHLLEEDVVGLLV